MICCCRLMSMSLPVPINTCSLTLANYDLQKPLLTKIIVSSKIFQFGRIKRKVLDKLFLRASSLVPITRKVIGQAHL